MSEGFHGFDEGGRKFLFGDDPNRRVRYTLDKDELQEWKGSEWSAQHAARGAGEGLEHLQRLQATDPRTATAAAQETLSLGYAAQMRQHVAHAAQKGLVSSRAFDEMIRGDWQQETAAQAALQAEELRERRATEIRAAQQIAQSGQALTKLPEEVGYHRWEEERTHEGGKYQTVPGSASYETKEMYSEERRNIQDAQQEGGRILNELRAKQPSYEDLHGRLMQEAEASYSVLANHIREMAKQRGMPESYVKGQIAQLEQDRVAVTAQLESFARAATGPDPQAQAAALGAVYSPPRLQALQEERINPLWGLGFGLAGAAVGGFVTKSPVGASLGYGLGSAVGTGIGAAYG